MHGGHGALLAVQLGVEVYPAVAHAGVGLFRALDAHEQRRAADAGRYGAG